MAAPSFASVMSQIAYLIDLSDEVEKFASAGTTGYVDLEAAAIQQFDGDYIAGVAAALDKDRGNLASLVEAEAVRGKLDFQLLQVAKAINSTSEDVAGIWRDLYDYMHANSQSVNSREFTFGTPSADAGNTGDGEFLRITVDENGYALEGWWPDSYTAEVEADARQLGVSYEEVFRVRGTERAKDELQRTGTGLDQRVVCVSERTSERYVRNPGFEVFTGTTPTAGSEQQPTAISGWSDSLGTFANVRMSVDQLYRTPPGSTRSFSVRFLDNESLEQDLVTENGTQFDPDTCYYVDVKVYREGNCDGTFTISLGGVSRSVTMTTLTNGAWTTIRLVATPGQNNWFNKFNANTLKIKYQLASRTTGTIYLDAGIFAPFTLLGGAPPQGRGGMGTWCLALSGRTPFVVGDKFTWSDSVGATRGVNQYWFAVGEYGYLPHVTGGTETIADR